MAAEPHSTQPMTPTQSVDTVLVVAVISGLALLGGASYWWLRRRSHRI
jgi:LPXTG-motif cell wall-anchored protein